MFKKFAFNARLFPWAAIVFGFSCLSGIILIFISYSDVRDQLTTIFSTIVPESSTSAVLGADTIGVDRHDTTKPQYQPKNNLEYVKVIEVIDGDTIKISGGELVRYIGINTPELKGSDPTITCFGSEAKLRNSLLVADKEVGLERDVSNRDKYGRLLRFVWVGRTLVNHQLVWEGFAKAATYPPDVMRVELFKNAEEVARNQPRGLWLNCE